VRTAAPSAGSVSSRSNAAASRGPGPRDGGQPLLLRDGVGDVVEPDDGPAPGDGCEAVEQVAPAPARARPGRAPVAVGDERGRACQQLRSGDAEELGGGGVDRGEPAVGVQHGNNRPGARFVFTGATGSLHRRNNFRRRFWQPILNGNPDRRWKPDPDRDALPRPSPHPCLPARVANGLAGRQCSAKTSENDLFVGRSPRSRGRQRRSRFFPTAPSPGCGRWRTGRARRVRLRFCR
jgi:hypothetical protein